MVGQLRVGHLGPHLGRYLDVDHLGMGYLG